MNKLLQVDKSSHTRKSHKERTWAWNSSEWNAWSLTWGRIWNKSAAESEREEIQAESTIEGVQAQSIIEGVDNNF